MNFIPGTSKGKHRFFQAGVIAIAVFATVLMSDAGAADITLYDGSLETTPDLQGWVSGFSSSVDQVCLVCPGFLCPVSAELQGYLQELCDLRPETSTQAAEQGVTVLDTIADGSELAGYMSIVPGLTPETIASLPDVSSILPGLVLTHPDMPESLDNTAGFNLSFEVRLLEEGHDYDERSGFSLVINTRDCSNAGCKGLEMGFWPGEIWVQGDDDDEKVLFFRALSSSFVTTKMTQYDLSIRGDAYELFADGASLLKGRLRDYSSYEDSFYVTVYQTPNFIFLGDDTEFAKAKISLASVHLRPLGLEEGLIALQVFTAAYAAEIPRSLFTLLDLDGDEKIGLKDVIQILQAITEEERR